MSVIKNLDQSGTRFFDAVLMAIKFRSGYRIIFVALVIGVLISIFSKPGYQANMSLQVSENGSSSGLLTAILGSNNGGSDFSSLNDENYVISEKELVKSLLFAGDIVDKFNGTIVKSECRKPLLKSLADNLYDRLFKHKILNYHDLTRCNSESVVSELEVPERWLEDSIKVSAVGNNKAELKLPNGDLVLVSIGQEFTKDYSYGQFKIKIDSVVDGEPTFSVKKISHEKATRMLIDSIHAKTNVKGSNIILVTMDGPNREKLVQMIKYLGELAATFDAQKRALEAARQLDFLTHQRPSLGSDLDASERKLADYETNHDLSDAEEQSKGMIEELSRLEQSLADARQKRAALLASETAQHPEIRAIDNSIRDLTNQRSQLMKNMANLPELKRGEAELKRNVAINSELYSSLLNNVQVLRMVAESSIGKVKIVDPPDAGLDPVSPNQLLTILMSLAGGVIVYLLMAAYHFSFKQTIFEPTEVSRQYSRVCAVVEESETESKKKEPSEKKIIALDDINSSVLDGLKMMNVSLDIANKGEKSSQVIVITGPTPGVGKSYIASNLSIILASNSKQKTLLIDGDLRRGKLHELFGVDRRNGLSEAIAEGTPVSEIIKKTLIPSLDLVTTGELVRNPTELVNGPRFAKLINELSGMYDRIIFDTAPTMIAETLAISNHADLVYLVVREALTTKHEIDFSVSLFKESVESISGIIYNGYRTRNIYSRYKYSYHY